jgi:hypothetical protein
MEREISDIDEAEGWKLDTKDEEKNEDGRY